MEDKDIEKIIEEKIEKLLEEKLPETLARKEDDIKKKKEDLEKERAIYVKKIRDYFPTAKTKKLSLNEVKEISEKLDELAQKVQYTPQVIPKQAHKKILGKGKHRTYAIILLALLSGLLVFVVLAKLTWGW